MHGAIARGLSALLGDAVRVRTATLEEPEHGLPDDVLDDTDVLTWWGHIAHDEVDDAVVDRVQEAVLGGMGLLALHSAHYSKVFQRLLGTSCSLRWRNEGERELVWTVDPAHPIAAGVPHPIVIDAHEMYGEHFDIPRARRARVRQLVRRRRGVPRRLLLSPRRGADLLLQPRRPGLPDLPPPRRPARDRQRGAAGRRRRRARRAPCPAAPSRRVGWFERAQRRAAARRRHRPRVGRPAAPRRLRRASPASRSSALAGLEEAVRAAARRASTGSRTRRALGGPARRSTASTR